MSFQVILKRCTDEQIAAKITEEVASMSGASPEQIKSAVLSKSISLGKDFSEEKALELKRRFEELGGEVSIKNLAVAESSSASTATSTSTSPTAVNNRVDDDDDDEEEESGRLLTEEEYVKALNSRKDIFVAEEDRKLRTIMPIVMLLAVAVGVFFAKVSLFAISPDFYNKMIEEKTVQLTDEIDLTKNLDEEKKEDEKKKDDFKQEKKKLKPSKGSGGKTGGGGDPRAVVTRKGVLGIISGAVKGQAVANSDIFGKGGYASGIDAVLQGVGGLKKGGGGGTGRKGTAGIGFGSGYGSGFGGNSGGVDDLLGSLMGGGGSNVKLKKRGKLKVKAPSGASSAGLTGGRSRANIMRVVRQNMPSLKYAYNRRLAEKPGLKGKITVKWAIDEFGKVLFCKVISSTINDPKLEQVVVQKIKRWAFGKINVPGDVTEVVYPFVFTQ